MQKLKKRCAAITLSACMLVGLSGTAALGGAWTASAQSMSENGGTYYTDYDSYDEAKKAAEELNIELNAEGSVLLKNDGTLPLKGDETISVFGSIENNLQNNTNVSDSVSTAFEKAGFKTNQALADFYRAEARDTRGVERTDFGRKVEQSFDLYNDVAVIVIGRAGGEMADLSTAIEEEEKETYLGEDQGWEHKDLYDGNDEGYSYESSPDDEGAYVHKHELQLTDSEQALVKYVEQQNFKHIVFVLNMSCAFETYNLEQDPLINAIVWIGRPGETGIHALPKLLSGERNFSGKVSDEWFKDFTADPVWQNFGYNRQHFGFPKSVTYTNPFTGQEGTTTEYASNYLYPDGTHTSDIAAPRFNGLNGIDIEEDIYLGYKYVETYYQDVYNGNQPVPAGYEGMTAQEAAKAWYEDTITHAFGSGLSYTDFSINIEGVYVDAAKTITLAEAAEDPSNFASSDGVSKVIQKYKKLYVDATVANTGEVSGKEVVQIYVSAPYYENGIEKPAMRLIAFGKTEELAPGEEQTLTIEANIQDMASYDFDDSNENGTRGYELDYGDYTIYASNSSHVDLATIDTISTDAQDKYEFTLGTGAGAVYQQLDDFSDNAVSNKFSDVEEGIYGTQYNSIRDDAAHNANAPEGQTYNVNNGNGAKMTRMNRTEGFVASYPAPPTVADMTLSQQFIDEVLMTARFDADFILDENGTPLYDETEEEWYVDENDIPAGWTQGTGVVDANGQYEYLLSDMAGIDPDGTTPIEGGVWDGKTGRQAWEEFMNQLTWDEIKIIIEQGNFTTAPLETINKAQGSDQDRPNRLGQTHNWCDEVVIASTWNTELARMEGIITANMGIYMGYTGWYGPGMNQHRSPFSGRNNDYYSQDGIHAGYMGVAVVQGAQSRGLNAFLKHFALNDQESTRNGMVLFLWGSEQTWREGGFKPFQMCMQEGQASSAMSGFARICGEPCNVNYRLLTGIAKEEWGYKGIFITDAEPGTKACASTDLMIRSGNGLMLRNNHVNDNYNRWEVSGTWNKELRGGKGGVMVGGDVYADKEFVFNDKVTNPETGEVGADYIGVNKQVANWNQYYYARQSAQTTLYQAANSVTNRNGVNFVEWSKGGTQALGQGVNANFSVAMKAENLNGATEVVYAVTDGQLPAGLALDETTGAVTGIVTGLPGDYEFTVTCTVDGWITGTATYTLSVSDAFTWDEDAPAKEGEEYYGTINTTVITEANGYTDIGYSLLSGELPEGLTLSANGAIEGTPVKAGTYDFVIGVTATSGRNTVTFSYAKQIVVADDGVAPIEIGENGNWFIDGKDTGVPAAGQNGTNGTDGKDGVTPTIEINDDGYWVINGTVTDVKATGTGGGCSGAIEGTAIAAAAAFAIIGLAIVIRRRKTNK